MLGSHRLAGWTAIFLLTTLLTSVTGFMFPIHGFTPALGIGIVATIIAGDRAAGALRQASRRVLALDLRRAPPITSLYLNVFVLIVQSFQKLSFLTRRRRRSIRRYPSRTLRDRARRRAGDLRRAGHRRGDQIPAGPRVDGIAGTQPSARRRPVARPAIRKKCRRSGKSPGEADLCRHALKPVAAGLLVGAAFAAVERGRVAHAQRGTTPPPGSMPRRSIISRIWVGCRAWLA